MEIIFHGRALNELRDNLEDRLDAVLLKLARIEQANRPSEAGTASQGTA